MQNTLVDTFIRMRSKQGVPEELVIDMDATDDPIHGDQLGKFFHGYYKSYCYMPLYAFCGAWPLGAVLRPSNIDGCAGTVQELKRIVPKLRAAWPPHTKLRTSRHVLHEKVYFYAIGGIQNNHLNESHEHLGSRNPLGNKHDVGTLLQK